MIVSPVISASDRRERAAANTHRSLKLNVLHARHPAKRESCNPPRHARGALCLPPALDMTPAPLLPTLPPISRSISPLDLSFHSEFHLSHFDFCIWISVH